MLSTNYVKEAKALIIKYNDLKIAEENLKSSLMEHELNMVSCGGQDLSGMPGGSRLTGDEKIANAVFKKEKLLEQLEKTQESLIKIEKAFEGLTEDERKTLIAALDDTKTDTLIAKELGISRQTLDKKKNILLKKFALQLWGIF